ncbi:Transposon Ty3-I Gag-Pol polyprotein [Labeo rohita]|uniref:Transposon Ty3-I Gag-Pol polyprotein n=1 Tax=Labeo rohita TaxID=84645 RepID=A0ABQ8LY43_LABRO|nr:Transposon Ty3-I Gag-Pol polyprotein [Labeo rohita]
MTTEVVSLSTTLPVLGVTISATTVSWHPLSSPLAHHLYSGVATGLPVSIGVSLEDPVPPPPASESRSSPRPFDAAAAPWLQAASSPLWPISPPALPGSLIPPALLWSVLDHLQPRDSTTPTPRPSVPPALSVSSFLPAPPWSSVTLAVAWFPPGSSCSLLASPWLLPPSSPPWTLFVVLSQMSVLCLNLLQFCLPAFLPAHQDHFNICLSLSHGPTSYLRWRGDRMQQFPPPMFNLFQNAGQGKVQVVQNWPKPNTIKELQRFLGLTNFYQALLPSKANYQLHSHLSFAINLSLCFGHLKPLTPSNN